MTEHLFDSHVSSSLKEMIEAHVALYVGHPWQIKTIIDKVDESSHPAALLSDGIDTMFVKIYQGPQAWDQLQIEVAGLALLRNEAGVLTPTVIDSLPLEDGALVIMESIATKPWDAVGWRAYGQALAQIHQAKSSAFGLNTAGYWGSLYQDNRPHEQWPDFFWLRRLEPRLRAAVDSGNLPQHIAVTVEQMAAHLPELCGPPILPTLLHGDAHQNNVINSPAGPVFLDPAVYYGHPEMDLAFVDFFSPVGEELYAGYAEVTPIDLGFEQRRYLWVLPAWLAMVELDGPQHVAALTATLDGISGTE